MIKNFLKIEISTGFDFSFPLKITHTHYILKVL